MAVKRIHHVAYRCRDAQETVDFYHGVLGMDYLMAISEDRVPSTKEPDPYMHIFFDAGGGSCLAFFELPTKAPMGKDPNTPDWVQHIAFEVEDEAAMMDMKARAAAQGLEVIGPTDHSIFQSVYFFDPNGHRLEFAWNTGMVERLPELKAVADEMLAAWNRDKKTVHHTANLHAKEFADA
jgi:catechol 2,3-dioxygenase-like lactoylglutathione lyase family enzyme